MVTDPYFQAGKHEVVIDAKGRVIGDIYRFDDRERELQPSRRSKKRALQTR